MAFGGCVLDTTRRFELVDEVVAADVGEQTVLLNVETGMYFGLDPVGTQIWKGLADGDDETALVARLVEQYQVSPEGLRSDVRAFIDELADEGLIRIAKS